MCVCVSVHAKYLHDKFSFSYLLFKTYKTTSELASLTHTANFFCFFLASPTSHCAYPRAQTLTKLWLKQQKWAGKSVPVNGECRRLAGSNCAFHDLEHNYSGLKHITVTFEKDINRQRFVL